MTNKLQSTATALALAAGLFATSAVYADEDKSATQGSMMPRGQMTGGQMGPGMMGGMMPGGQGGMMGPGMMGPGMMGGMMHGGQGGMMGSGMMGGMMPGGEAGMMGPGMMGQGFGDRVVPSKHLSTDDVRHFLEHRLDRRGNKRLKVGDVKEEGKDSIIAEIVTVDDSLVERLKVDRHSGLLQRVE